MILPTYFRGAACRLVLVVAAAGVRSGRVVSEHLPTGSYARFAALVVRLSVPFRVR